MGITTLALAINGQTGWRFGTTPLASITFARSWRQGLAVRVITPTVEILPPAARPGGWLGVAVLAVVANIVAAGIAVLALAINGHGASVDVTGKRYVRRCTGRAQQRHRHAAPGRCRHRCR